MSVSLKDIAKELNLSVTTVSWVLSNQGTQKRISKATQDKIRAYAKSVNYKPNLLARGLNTGKSGTIGLILPSISDSFYSQIARYIELDAEKYGYTLMICSSESEVERESRMIQMFKAKQIDGLVIAPTKYIETDIISLMNEDFPFVLFDRFFENLNTNYIIINNEECSHDLVTNLVKEGRKKIAIMLTNPHLTIMKMRYNGYKRALEEAGIEINPDLCGVVDFAGFEKNIGTVLGEILNKVPDLDGIFFATHILAINTFMYFAEKGINFRDMGLATLNSIPAFKLVAPHMWIAEMPVKEMGINAVRILHNNIQAKLKNEICLPETLVLKCTFSS